MESLDAGAKYSLRLRHSGALSLQGCREKQCMYLKNPAKRIRTDDSSDSRIPALIRNGVQEKKRSFIVVFFFLF